MNISSLFKKKIFREILTYSIGSFGSKVLSFLLFPFYTYFLSQNDLGEYDLLITLVTLFVPLVSLQISDATYRWLIGEEYVTESDKQKVIANAIFILVIGAVIFSACFVVYTFFKSFNYQIYFLLLIFLNSLLPLLQSILRGLGKTKYFAANGVITTFLVVIFNVIFVYYLKLNIKGVFLAYIIAYTISCAMIVYHFKLFQYLKIRYWNFNLVKSMVGYCLPLIPNLMSWWVISSASKFIILHYEGIEANGLYAVATRFSSLLLVVNSVLLLPLQDSVLKEKKDTVFYKMLNKFIVFEIILVFGLALFSPLMTKILVAEEYFITWQYIPFLYLGVGFNAIAGFLGLKYQKKKTTLKITSTSFVGAIVSIVFSFILVQSMGLQGISISFMLGFLSVLLLRYIDITKRPLNNACFYLILAAPIACYLSVLLMNNVVHVL
ncbi:lipopolysaccharide biosynthesis protein [Pseudotamlana agarivorans]|uniref:lipopolysaccharide biosynthesis protein n=1 Tax=Pseudotamlana agarivorans TaxID=481183 RepID=UPI00082E1DF5|nr:oligosaccharide flippase family protein [Tamlana agarivorans]